MERETSSSSVDQLLTETDEVFPSILDARLFKISVQFDF